jgi:hypothetical protein
MSVNLLTPFTVVPRRSAPIAASTDLYEGRWAGINSSGEATLPSAGGRGLLILEGNKKAVEGTTFGAGPTFTPVQSVALPSNAAAASNQASLAYGVFRFEVGPEGFVAASLVAGSGLELDAAGRLVILASGLRVATVETVSATKLVARTLGE